MTGVIVPAHCSVADPRAYRAASFDHLVVRPPGRVITTAAARPST